ncbi:MAG: outer membrane beta-barrel protein [Fibrobacterales bacterium]
MKTLLILIALLTLPLFAQQTTVEQEPAIFELGGGLGWNAPYGLGVELGYYPLQAFNINLGAGMSMAGFKYGLGAKYFINPQNRLSPFLAGNYYHSGGVDNLLVTVNEDEGTFKISPAHTLQLAVGARLAVGKISLYCKAGYGVAVSGGKSSHLAGSDAGSLKSGAELMEPHGVEISVGMAFKIQ